MNTQEVVARHYKENIERMRSQAEITAKYRLACQNYKNLKQTCTDKEREQLIMLYAEAKALSWVLGKSENTFSRDTNF